MGNEFVCTAPLLLLAIALGACFIRDVRLRERIVVAAVFIVIAGFLCLRAITVMCDTYFYYNTQEQILSLPFWERWDAMASSTFISRFEPLYRLYMLVLSVLWQHPYAVVAVTGAIIAAAFTWMSARLTPLTAITAFMLWLPAIQWTSTFRQGLASVVFLIAFVQLMRHRRVWLYLALTVVAIFTHHTAIILLPLPLLFRLKPNVRNLLITLGVFALLAIFIFKLFSLTIYYQHVYVQKSLDRLCYPGALMFAALMTAITAVTLLLRHRIGSSDRPTDMMLWCAVLCIGFYLLGGRISELHRLAWYFTPLAVCGFARVAASAVRHGIKTGGLVLALEALAFYVFYVGVCLLRPEWFELTPYIFI